MFILIFFTLLIYFLDTCNMDGISCVVDGDDDDDAIYKHNTIHKPSMWGGTLKCTTETPSHRWQNGSNGLQNMMAWNVIM